MVIVKMFLYYFKKDSTDVGPGITVKRWVKQNNVAFSIPRFTIGIRASVWELL